MSAPDWDERDTDWHDALLGRAELKGDALRAQLAALADELRADVGDYLDGHPGGDVAAHDAYIRAHIVASAVRDFNRRAQGTRRLPETAIDRIFERLRGLGPVAPLLEDPTITQAIITGPGKRAFVERQGRWEDTEIVCTEEELLHAVERMQLLAGGGHPLNPGNPVVEIYLPRARVTALDKSIKHQGPELAIRLRSETALTAEDLLAEGMLPRAAFDFLSGSLRGGANLVIGGEMGAGKTTLMQALLLALPPDRHIVTIEDPLELDLGALPHVSPLVVIPADVHGQGGVNARYLVRLSVRLKANHVVVGEVRDGAAWDMVDVLSWGHGGSVSTVHGSSPRGVLTHLETLCLRAHDVPPLAAVRRTLADALHLIVVVQQVEEGEGSRRVVTAISEVTGLEGDVYRLQDLWAWEDGTLEPTGVEPSPHLAPKLRRGRVTAPAAQGRSSYRARLDKNEGDLDSW